MVTRTFITTLCNVMVVDATTNSVVNCDKVIPEKVDLAGAEKFFRKNWVADVGIFVRVNSVQYNEQIYGMDESVFLKYATALDDKRKPIK